MIQPNPPYPSLEIEPWRLSSWDPPATPSEGVARRIGFKRLEEETLDPVITSTVLLEQQVQSSGPESLQAAKLSKIVTLQTMLAKITTARTHLAAVMQATEQEIETQQTIEMDELNRVTRHQIVIKQARVKELEALLNEKLENEKSMDQVRRQPSRLESTREIDKLQRTIKIMQEQTLACQAKLDAQCLEFRSAVLSLLTLQDGLDQNIHDRAVLRQNLTAPPSKDAELTLSSSNLLLRTSPHSVLDANAMDVDDQPVTDV